jgi:hypothetical protein
MDDLSLAPEARFETSEAKEPRTPDRLYSLKESDLFLVCDAFGDIRGGADGLFLDDTRLLSRWTLRLDGGAPALLSTAVSQDNVVFTAHCTNRPLTPIGMTTTPEGVVHIERKRPCGPAGSTSGSAA